MGQCFLFPSSLFPKKNFSPQTINRRKDFVRMAKDGSSKGTKDKREILFTHQTGGENLTV